MLYGWKGKILRVDLAAKRTAKEDLPEEWMRKYIGCRGINTIILYNEVGPDVDPFGPDNKLIFGTGPLEGTPIGMGRVSIQTKHCNRFIGEGGAGGDWAPELKYAGYDFIVIEKKSAEPVYLYINDDEVELRDAKDLWGKDTRETNRLLREKTGIPDIQVASIGQAGENLVANSKVIFTLNHAGCRGCGTIMGDKKLKAIAVHGTGGVKVKDPAEFLRAYREIRNRLDLKETSDALIPSFAFMGANFFLRVWNETRFLHAYNAQKGSIEGFLTPEQYLKDYVTGPKTGFCCPLPACGRRYEVREGKYATTWGDEREAGFSLGAAIVGMTSWAATLKVRNLCSRYGLDEFQVLYTIGWAMECYQRGIITKGDTGGIDLRFGNEDAVVEMTERIALRQGFGNILANGCQEAAKMIGKGSERYLLTIKGKELEVMPQRPIYSIALCLAVCEGGPDHTRWYPPFAPNPRSIPKDLALPFDTVNAFIPRSVEGKASWAKFLYDASAVFESMPTCLFVLRNNLGIDMRPWLNVYNACTGVNYSMDEFMKVGERIVNLERAYIVREGFRRADDTIPRRMLEEPIADGHIPPIGKNLDIMLDDYYTLRGWDVKSAIPREEKLRELDLDFAIDDLRNLR